MPDYLKLQHNTWSIRWRVPRDVRDHPFFEGKREIVVTTRTKDKSLARLRAATVVATFKAQVLEARGNSGAVAEELEWRKRLAAARAAEAADPKSEEYGDTMEAYQERHAERFNVKHHNGLDDLMARSGPRGQRSIKIVLGMETPLEPLIEPWAAQYAANVEKKTLNMAKGAVKRFIAEYPSAQLVTPKVVGEWVARRTSDESASPRTVRRELGSLRSFWTYLRDKEHVVGGAPFDGHKIGRAKDTHNTKREPFEPHDVVRLHREAMKRGDKQLADLIKLAAYTGARINELCMLKAERCGNEVLRIDDSKTKAGIRSVPVHSKIKQLVKGRIKRSSDGFLFSSLSSANKYEDRAHGIGHRFSRLKQKLGFGEKHVFHSFRNTVVTQLVQADVRDNVINDIVGHEYAGMRGRYLKECSMEQKAEAIEKLSYPGL